MRPGRSRGYTYLLMLFSVAIVGAVLASGGVVWRQEAQRARERELLLIGEEFRQAIGLYYERTPGGMKRYPEKLEELLGDDRYVSLQRYLRRVYRDPMTAKTEWGFVKGPGNSIIGVYSLAKGKPKKATGFGDINVGFEEALSYSDWKFVYIPPAPQPVGNSARSAANDPATRKIPSNGR